ncbi:MAG: hypothetical protein EBS01_02210 [Verrucomicrobia bacterium]|nr:hypothetical protein [Verrucomicrobiota bacterium]
MGLFGLFQTSALDSVAKDAQHIIIASEAGAKLDSDVTTGGGTDDTELIQSILDRAPKLGSLKLIVDGPVLVRGLKVHSNTTVECLNRACGFSLADNSNCPLIANATPQPEGRADRNLSFLGGTYNGNAEHQQHTTPEHGWTTAFALHGVEQVLFRDVSITNSRTFAVYLTNWRRVVFENIYINLDHIPKSSNQDGIHVQGPGEFLSIRNVQGRAWDDMIALNIDDLLGDWDSGGKFGRDPASIKRFGSAAGIGPVSDVDIDGVQADDCAQVLRILSRASRLDRVSIRNVKGTYRDFGVWITPYLREGGNIGRLEFENIDLRPVAPRGYDYVPPFLFWFAGKMEQVTLKNISSHVPIDDRPLVWIQPDAQIDRLLIEGLNVFDPRQVIGRTPLIRADGRIALLQVRDVVVQRPQAASPAGSLIGTSTDRSALKAFMDARAGIVTPPGKSRRGWPEGFGYLTALPQIQRLQMSDIVADGLEQLLDHQAGTIESLDLRDVSVSEITKVIHQGSEAKILKTKGVILK